MPSPAPRAVPSLGTPSPATPSPAPRAVPSPGTPSPGTPSPAPRAVPSPGTPSPGTPSLSVLGRFRATRRNVVTALAVAAVAGAAPLLATTLVTDSATRQVTANSTQDPQTLVGIGERELEAARADDDPVRFAAAQAAFDRALRMDDGNSAARAGQSALLAARHRFAPAAEQARAALAINPASAPAMAALVDALTELGQYPQALAEAQRLDRTRPGLASFARLSYQYELRGDLPRALQLMRDAADEAATPSQAAFARLHEGLLALAVGDAPAARHALAAGRAVAPDDTGLFYLAARLARADGDLAAEMRSLQAAVDRRPTVTYATELADALRAAGRTRDAAAALDVARAARQRARTAGVATEAGEVIFEAERGSPAEAVRLGARVWRAAPSVTSADAYAWALHRAGRDAEALPMADRAIRLGTRDAMLRYHRAAVLAALGRADAAAQDLRMALAAGPGTLTRPAAADAVRLLARSGGTR